MQGVQGSGPGGRIVSKDLLGVQTQPMAAAPSPDGGYTDFELSNMRKVKFHIYFTIFFEENP